MPVPPRGVTRCAASPSGLRRWRATPLVSRANGVLGHVDEDGGRLLGASPRPSEAGRRCRSTQDPEHVGCVLGRHSGRQGVSRPAAGELGHAARRSLSERASADRQRRGRAWPSRAPPEDIELGREHLVAPAMPPRRSRGRRDRRRLRGRWQPGAGGNRSVRASNRPARDRRPGRWWSGRPSPAERPRRGGRARGRSLRRSPGRRGSVAGSRRRPRLAAAARSCGAHPAECHLSLDTTTNQRHTVSDERQYCPTKYEDDRSRIEIPVLVVGAGPAGLVAAITLARHGVECLIVERRHTRHAAPGDRDQHPHHGAAPSVGLHDEVLRGGDDVEWLLLLCATLSRARQGRAVEVGYPTRAQSALVSPTAPACVPQDHLETVLLDHLRSRASAAWSSERSSWRSPTRRRRRPRRPLRDGPARRRTVTPGIVGADGARSSCGRRSASRFAGPTSSSTASVVVHAPLWDVSAPTATGSTRRAPRRGGHLPARRPG